MTQYFFDTFDGLYKLHDLEGFDLPDRASAISAAASALSDMARDALPNGLKQTFSVHIRDERGQWFVGTLEYNGRETRQS